MGTYNNMEAKRITISIGKHKYVSLKHFAIILKNSCYD